MVAGGGGGGGGNTLPSRGEDSRSPSDDPFAEFMNGLEDRGVDMLEWGGGDGYRMSGDAVRLLPLTEYVGAPTPDTLFLMSVDVTGGNVGVEVRPGPERRGEYTDTGALGPGPLGILLEGGDGGLIFRLTGGERFAGRDGGPNRLGD